MHDIEELSAAQEEINEIAGEQIDIPLDMYPVLGQMDQQPESVMNKAK